MKVFDCQWNPGMPSDVYDAFRRIFEGTQNDVIVGYTVQDERFEKGEEESEWAQDKNKLDAWLIANGAQAAPSDDDSGEDVLIKHWW